MASGDVATCLSTLSSVFGRDRSSPAACTLPLSLISATRTMPTACRADFAASARPTLLPLTRCAHAGDGVGRTSWVMRRTPNDRRRENICARERAHTHRPALSVTGNRTHARNRQSSVPRRPARRPALAPASHRLCGLALTRLLLDAKIAHFFFWLAREE